MSKNDNDGQMIFGDLVGLKFPDSCLTGEEKPQKNLSQETCPDRGSNPVPLRDRRACYRLPAAVDKVLAAEDIRMLNRKITTNCQELIARHVGSDGSMSASDSAGPGFNPRRDSKF